MRKDKCYCYAVYQGLDDVGQNIPDAPLPEFDDSPLGLMLKEIFQVDPFTGFPRGDIQYYLSSEGNPQVKQWLENNLLKPRMISTGSSLEGVTDDMIAEFSRMSGESVDSYRLRLMSIYDDAKKQMLDLISSEDTKSD